LYDNAYLKTSYDIPNESDTPVSKMNGFNHLELLEIKLLLLQVLPIK
jgi:hypothetical protein